MSTRLDRAQRGRHVPLPRRRVERRRHHPRIGPVVPHRPRADRCRPAASTASRSPRRGSRLPSNPQGRGTVAYFEYGTTSALGSRTPDVDAGLRDQRRRRSSRRSPASSPGRATTTGSSRGATPAARTGQTRSFTTTEGPLVTTGPAQVSGATVVLTGTVDPFGHSTNWWFELGKTTSYGTSTVVKNAGSGRGGVAVSVSVAGLAAGTEYHARLVAKSSAGTTRGADVVFRTAGLPVVGRPTASAISLTRARIGTEVATSGLETRVWVEVSRRGAVVLALRRGRAPALGRRRASVSIPVTGLSPGTRYAFRVLASNAAGTANGPTASFGTAGASARRARTARPLHDRRDERAGPARGDAAARRDLRARRRRRPGRAAKGTTSCSADREPTTSLPARGATGSSPAPATTSSGRATAERTGCSADRARTARASTGGSTSRSRSPARSGEARVPTGGGRALPGCGSE